MSTTVIAAKDLSKSFGRNAVLKGIEFAVNEGEAVALCGENGAGKSTLIKLLTGLYHPTAGHVEFMGAPVNWTSTRESLQAGIAVVHQEFSVIGALTVAENIFLEDEPKTRFGLIDRQALKKNALDLLKKLGITLDPDQTVDRLSVAEKQMVEIAKAMRTDAKVLILDEPTAVLSENETQHLFEMIASLRARGLGIIYVSHRLDEIFEICSHITVIKDGVVTSSGPVSDYTHDSVVAAMVGREIGDLFPPKASSDAIGDIVLDVNDMIVEDGLPSVSLNVRAGEIVGLAGLVGSGRTELALGLFGAEPATGSVKLGGELLDKRSPAKSLDAGMVLLTESRADDGLFTNISVAWNFASTTLGKDTSDYAISPTHEEERSQSLIDRFNLVVDHVGLPIRALSGGNQQKVLIGRILENAPKLLILDEPTRGVDVGAKADIYRELRALANQGMAILVISSELIEIVGLSDRCYVMRDREIAAELHGDGISENGIIAVAAADTETHGGGWSHD